MGGLSTMLSNPGAHPPALTRGATNPGVAAGHDAPGSHPDAGCVLAPAMRATSRPTPLITMTRLTAVLTTLLALPPRPAAGAPPELPLRPVAYALVVGANRGGPGQGPLRYAEQDAHRVADLLTQLGGYRSDRVELLEQPDREQLGQALGRITRRLQEHASRGEKSLFLFYYSGHARASGLNLARETLALDQLRVELQALPSTVVLAVLDACQSGAFSRVKGGELTADFSYNSVTQLSTAGIAVMASSGGSELSQESDRLQSSFFTHHLLAALRGAADLDRDGFVTLAEAYRYAYHRTLADTATTSVGSQHVTLETGLRGKGEVVLSYPAQASAQLDLPVALTGQFLIERVAGGSVIAELHKAAGEAMRLALAPGEYRAVWRHQDDVRECRFQLRDGQVTTVDAAACTAVEDGAVASKGAADHRTRWAADLGLGLSTPQGYTANYHHTEGFWVTSTYDHVSFEAAAVRTFSPIVELRLTLRPMDSQSFQRRYDTGEQERFSFRVFGLGPELRALAHFWRLSIYLQGGLGLTLGRTSYTTALDERGQSTAATQVVHTWFRGFYGSISNGLAVRLYRSTQLYLQLRYSEVKNLGAPDRTIEQRGHVTDMTSGLRLGW